MATYLYCVLPADAPAPLVDGIDGAPLRAIRASGVCVWVGDVTTAPKPDLEHIRDHDRVIRAAMDTGHTPVPVRFGQIAAGDDDVLAHLASRDYLPDLERIRGCVEFGIRILDPDAHDDPPPSAEQGDDPAGKGAAHMRLLAARVHALERTRARALGAARALDEALAGLARDRRVAPSDRPAGAVVAHLVQASSADTYAARAREQSHAHPPLRIVVTGPWPPYSFVE